MRRRVGGDVEPPAESVGGRARRPAAVRRAGASPADGGTRPTDPAPTAESTGTPGARTDCRTGACVSRGEIYRTRERVAERGHKPVSTSSSRAASSASNEDVSTVICAPVYGEVLGLTTEVVLGPDEGLPRSCAARCDFLTLLFKAKLTHFVGTLSARKLA